MRVIRLDREDECIRCRRDGRYEGSRRDLGGIRHPRLHHERTVRIQLPRDEFANPTGSSLPPRGGRCLHFGQRRGRLFSTRSFN